MSVENSGAAYRRFFFHCLRTAGGRGSYTTPLIRTQVKFKYLLECGHPTPIFFLIQKSSRVCIDLRGFLIRGWGQADLFAPPPLRGDAYAVRTRDKQVTLTLPSSDERRRH